MAGTSEGARKGWLHRKRGHKSKLPSENQRVRRTLGGILRKGPDAETRRMIRQTPSTGHLEGSSKKMVREVDNWPNSWMPAGSPARRKLTQEIARDPDETYVYYPIGSHKPVIWYRDRRWSLDDFQQKYG